MARDSELPPESLDEILAWLHPDRDAAAQMYVQLRHDLTKIFTWNRCADPEGLTDETFDRIAKKVHNLRQTYEGDPRLYFHGVAKNLIKEAPKRAKTHVSLDDINIPANTVDKEEAETAELREECLHQCLEKLSSEEQELIHDYYAKEKQAKIKHRADVARKFGTSLETLRVRVYRVRAKLQQCIRRCLKHAAQKK